jgi:hypothetical protein
MMSTNNSYFSLLNELKLKGERLVLKEVKKKK